MRSNSTFAVLLGGTLEIDDRVLELIQGARVIAADGGMRHAQALGVLPEVWVGDFDSTPDGLSEFHAATPRMPFPAEKNFTDGELAIEQAIERGATRLVLIGSFGGERTDHALSHLLLAVTLAERGFEVVLTSGQEEAVPLLPGLRELDLPAGSLFSVIAFSALTGLSLRGAKYPLDQADIAFGASRTISNVAQGPVTVRLNAGRALIIARPHDFSGA
ncbi:thiamine pyrophosphokinase [Hoeflea halophila]|uniref:Thiamine diphosphokinase n=1 Tax=Hoeflea halophila TaxID=714899 RepID=A0A286I9A7_9HYPH|nr:thiamine diphosphokinase [Hoeflea halophila]SOE16713.1 thiamine pyrophosphokinase [Hoeflea halophila]